MKINDLTFTEEFIMRVLWSLKSGYLKDIILAHPEPRPHQNTISTYLKILQEKKYISAEKEGRIYLYHADISLKDYRTHVLSQFLERYYDQSAPELVQNLLAENWITIHDLEVFCKDKPTAAATVKRETEENSAVSDYILQLTKPKKKKKKKKKK